MDHKKSLLLQEENNNNNNNNGDFLSQITFQWLNPLFEKGRNQKLELDNVPCVPRVPHSEASESASSLLEESLLHTTKTTSSSSLSKALLLATWKSLLLTAIFAGLNTLASFIGPFLISNFVNYLTGKNEEEDSSIHDGLVLAFFFFLAKTLESLTQRHWYYGTHRIGIQVRAALTVIIYKKSLSIDSNLAATSNGIITNLVSVDLERIGDFSAYIHKIWLLPVQIVLALFILYTNLGPLPSITALLATILVMASNTPLANVQKRLHTKIMDAKDSRIKLTSETLKNIRVLKLHSWEQTFLGKVLQLRDVERGWVKKYLYTCSVVAFLFWVSPTLVSVLTFGVCIIMNIPLTVGTVLAAIATFRILQEPIYNLPELVSMIAQTEVSLDRIQEFIQEEDQRKQSYYPPSNSSDIMIEIEEGEYCWEENFLTIKVGKKMQIPKGYKVAICGSVGSGKSSLLCSMLGEIPQTLGTPMKVSGTKAYVPQSAWIQSGTVRENVLFGKEMTTYFYEDVLEACALNQDIKHWQKGDFTVVGERGMNLSGGQKQRIQLARAIYSDADVYFLDDPFSAVDACTGTHLFKRCLLQLLSDKTVMYATNNLEFIETADLVLVMKNGCIVQLGKYADLISDSNGELARHIAAHRRSLSGVKPLEEDKLHHDMPCQVHQIDALEEESSQSLENGSLLVKAQEEETHTSRVKWSVYTTFITSAYKGALVPVILLCQVLFQTLQIGSNYWLAWATEEDNVNRGQLIGIFILMSGGSSIFILGRALLMTTIAIETANKMFLEMVTAVFAAPISFFDAKPSSQILTRSSTDQSILDTDIPYRLGGLVFALIQLLSIIILISKVAWQIFPLFLAVLAISVWYQRYYICTARELARMVGIRKAPILHHFSETVVGATVIRCFNQEDHFLEKTLNLIDDYSRVVFHNSTSMEWLCLRINFLFDIVFFLALIILVALPRSAINPSLAGLAATYALNMNIVQSWVIWNLCNVENKMISVERILQFSNIASEAPPVVEGCRPMPEWPEEGRIEFQNLHVQYRPNLPMILKGITCTFPERKKIAIVGRTGSGKSTLIQTLFRVVEPSAGRILIDGVDICKMGLHDLRSKLGIIPQDPTLFQGTMRTNLDPLQQHTNQEIWEVLLLRLKKVLNKCRFADIIRTDQILLEAPVAEDGENWSVGQRQLVCLARVLLKKYRILVLDEATASIDVATENIVQEIIQKETNGCTVITVAHRIPTVIDHDLVLVLDEGKVVEYDSPSRLLENSSSTFSKLVAEFLRRSYSSHS